MPGEWSEARSRAELSSARLVKKNCPAQYPLHQLSLLGML